jgi:3-hydroxyisobutyrate dehydrogenase
MSEHQQVLMVGMGKMGGAIASRLVGAGQTVLGFDLSPVARELAAKTGVTPVQSLAEGLASSKVVLTSLPDPKAVRAVYSDPGGIVDLLQPGSLVIELSTIGPVTMREVASQMVDKVPEVKVVDSPVSGGIEEASLGKLSLMVGGSDDAVETARAVLENIGTIHHCGGLGDGKVMKLVNNLVAISNVLGAVEALALADAAGVDPQVLQSVLSQSGASSYQLNKRLPRVIDHDLAPRFSLALATKDLRLALTLADELSVDLPSGRAVLGRFTQAEDNGWGAQDMAAVAQFYRYRKMD